MEYKKHINFLTFKNEVRMLFNPNGGDKMIPWGPDNLLPFEYLKLYNEVPEHTSSIDFITNLILGEGLNTDKIDYWLAKKLVNDFDIFGGFALQVIKTRGGDYIISYVDISKCRYSLDKTKIGYAEEGWDKYKQEYKWYNLTSDMSQEGIFIYKTNTCRELYPKPYYQSTIKSLSTMSYISEYHNNNAANGFAPSVVINMNNGIPDNDTQKAIEKGIKEKFTGERGQKFILSFNETPETKTTIEKLENDNLDQKFETLQKFIQNQIIVGHKITSGTLIGIKPENQGFSKTEFNESLDVFKEVVINGFRKELEYAFSLVLKTPVKFIDKIEPVVPDTTTNAGGQA